MLHDHYKNVGGKYLVKRNYHVSSLSLIIVCPSLTLSLITIYFLYMRSTSGTFVLLLDREQL